MAVVEWPDHSKNFAGILGHESLWIVVEENANHLAPRATVGPDFFASQDHRRDSKRVDRMMRVYRPIDFQANPIRP